MGNNAPKEGRKAYSMKLADKNKLGVGSFSEVYKITTKDKKTEYAAKIFKVPLNLFYVLDGLYFLNDLRILKETCHPFVVKSID
jgi:hypothetical protein